MRIILLTSVLIGLAVWIGSADDPPACPTAQALWANWEALPAWVQQSWAYTVCHPEFSVKAVGQTTTQAGTPAIWAIILVPTSKPQPPSTQEAVFAMTELTATPTSFNERPLLQYKLGLLAFGHLFWRSTWNQTELTYRGQYHPTHID
jgi:hypothetical protein